jgi:hypothetical protein
VTQCSDRFPAAVATSCAGWLHRGARSEVPEPEVALIETAGRRKVDLEIVRPGEWLTWQPRK